MTTLDTTPVAPPARPRRRSRRWTRSAVLLCTVGVVGLLFASRLSGQAPVRSVLLGKAAPGLQGQTLDGAPFDLSQWRGQVVLVNVWASWCVPCQREQPLLAAAYRDLAPRGLKMVGINVRDQPGAAKGFLASYGQASWPSVRDPDGRRAVDWGTFALPETYLVDRDGIIVSKAIGELDAAWIRDNVEPWLAAGSS